MISRKKKQIVHGTDTDVECVKHNTRSTPKTKIFNFKDVKKNELTNVPKNAYPTKKDTSSIDSAQKKLFIYALQFVKDKHNTVIELDREENENYEPVDAACAQVNVGVEHAPFMTGSTCAGTVAQHRYKDVEVSYENQLFETLNGGIIHDAPRETYDNVQIGTYTDPVYVSTCPDKYAMVGEPSVDHHIKERYENVSLGYDCLDRITVQLASGIQTDQNGRKYGIPDTKQPIPTQRECPLSSVSYDDVEFDSEEDEFVTSYLSMDSGDNSVLAADQTYVLTRLAKALIVTKPSTCRFKTSILTRQKQVPKSEAKQCYFSSDGDVGSNSPISKKSHRRNKPYPPPKPALNKESKKSTNGTHELTKTPMHTNVKGVLYALTSKSKNERLSRDSGIPMTDNVLYSSER